MCLCGKNHFFCSTALVSDRFFQIMILHQRCKSRAISDPQGWNPGLFMVRPLQGLFLNFAGNRLIFPNHDPTPALGILAISKSQGCSSTSFDNAQHKCSTTNPGLFKVWPCISRQACLLGSRFANCSVRSEIFVEIDVKGLPSGGLVKSIWNQNHFPAQWKGIEFFRKKSIFLFHGAGIELIFPNRNPVLALGILPISDSQG